MGQGQSQEEGEEFIKSFQTKYDFVRELNDPRFGDIYIYKDKIDDNYVFVKGHWCNSEEDYQNFLKQCSNRMNLSHKNVLKMIGFHQQSDTQICGDFSKITVYYEYFSHNLEKELDRRHSKSEYFTEQEIWFLLESIVSACEFFEQKKIYHGDIRPINILLTQQGFVKIADHGLVHQDKNGYIKALTFNEQTYLSPILMNALGRRELKPEHNVFKSDVYSLGMTMIEVCCLFTSRSCYDYGNYKIQKNIIEELLARARSRYSSFLVNLIREMLNDEERDRPSFSDIKAILNPYAEQIQNLQPFQADYSTIKRSLSQQPQTIPIQQPQVISEQVKPIPVQTYIPQQTVQATVVQPTTILSSQSIQPANPQVAATAPNLYTSQQPTSTTYTQILQPEAFYKPQSTYQTYSPLPIESSKVYYNIPQASYQNNQPQTPFQLSTQPLNYQATSTPSTYYTPYGQSFYPYSPYRENLMKTSQPIEIVRPEQFVSSQPIQQIYQPQIVGQQPIHDSSDIDRRVREALKTSEETIMRHSTTAKFI